MLWKVGVERDLKRACLLSVLVEKVQRFKLNFFLPGLKFPVMNVTNTAGKRDACWTSDAIDRRSYSNSILRSISRYYSMEY